MQNSKRDTDVQNRLWDSVNMDFHVYGQWERVAYPTVLFFFVCLFVCVLRKPIPVV